jgi:hypothetical protein
MAVWTVQECQCLPRRLAGPNTLQYSFVTGIRPHSRSLPGRSASKASSLYSRRPCKNNSLYIVVPYRRIRMISYNE